MKVKWSQRVGRGIALLFHDRGSRRGVSGQQHAQAAFYPRERPGTHLEGGEWSAACPGRILPPGKNRYPFYRRLGGPQARYWRAENFFPTGIRSRTVQPVVQSLYRLSYPTQKQQMNNRECISIIRVPDTVGSPFPYLMNTLAWRCHKTETHNKCSRQ